MGPESSRCKDRHIHTQKEDSHVKLEAETGAMHLKAKGPLGLLEMTRSLEDTRQDPPLVVERECSPTDTLIFNF